MVGLLFGLSARGPAGAADTTATATDEAGEPDHAHARHRLVRILDNSISPEEQVIDAGDAFGWANYSKRDVEITFDASVAEKLLCESRGAFRLDGGKLRSGWLRPASFATLCRLAPGEYVYQVQLQMGVAHPGTGTPTTREAKLIVREGG